METSVWVFSGDEAHQPEKFLSWGYRGNLPRKETLKPEMRELHGKQITSIFAGKNHMAAVSGAWKLYMWGENSTGQLGLDSEYIETHYVPTPTLVSNDMLDLHPIKMVALGKYHSVCITDDGVVAWGKTELLGQPLTKPTKQTSSTLFLESTTVSIPQVIPMSEPVTHVSCGAGHTTLTTESGDLYTFGTGSMGQLGHGDTSDRSQPTLVEALKKGNRFIVSAACGGFHTIAVTRDGKVYAFGLASYGQTGQGPGTESVINTPRVVSLPQGVQISAAACGESHSLLLSTQGHVYAFGYNIYGQCGQGNRRDQHSPMAVKFEAGASENPPKIDTIACGNNHNAAVTSDGKLYMWGNGGKHQITKATKDRLAPELIPISEVTSVEHALVSSVALGETFTMVLLGGPTKTPTTTINTDLSTLLLVHDFSDIKFTVRDDLRFHAHKVIVFNRCPALREEFGEGTSEIKLPDIGKEAIYKILEYLYTDYTYVEEESATAKEVLEFSGKYGLTKLANMCGVLSEGSPSTFIKDLTTALQNAPKFHDISFSVGETQIHANKAILAARCKFFRAMFTSGYQESVQETIEITDCREQTFATFLEWCYTDRINLNLPQTNNTNNSTNNTENSSENNENSNENGREEGEEGSSLLPEMLVLADKYGAFGLFRQVEARMLEGVDPSNILALLQFAETYNANFLGEFCLNFIAREYDTLATRVESEASEDVLRRVREKRAAMLVGSREERLRREMAERMRAYEIERNESVTNPEISMGLIADIMKARKEKGEEERKVKGPSTQPNCRTS